MSRQCGVGIKTVLDQWNGIKRSETEPDMWSIDFWHRCRVNSIEKWASGTTRYPRAKKFILNPYHRPYKN